MTDDPECGPHERPAGAHRIADLSRERTLWIARNILPHEAAIRAHLRRWGLPVDLDEDDVIQETYSRFVAMNDVSTIQHARNYAISTARSVVLMHVRHARVVSIRSVDDLDTLSIASPEPDPEVHVSDREQLHLLAVAVSELPEPNRKAFLLRMIDELSHREIGDRLGMSDNAVQKCIARSLAFLLTRVERGGTQSVRASRLHAERAISEIHVETRDER